MYLIEWKVLKAYINIKWSLIKDNDNIDKYQIDINNNIYINKNCKQHKNQMINYQKENIYYKQENNIKEEMMNYQSIKCFKFKPLN